MTQYRRSLISPQLGKFHPLARPGQFGKMSLAGLKTIPGYNECLMDKFIPKPPGSTFQSLPKVWGKPTFFGFQCRTASRGLPGVESLDEPDGLSAPGRHQRALPHHAR